MKNPTACFRRLFGFALMATAVTGCRTTSTTEVPLAYTVVGIEGDARWFNGKDEAAHAIKWGDEIPQGATIQTASGMGNVVLLIPDNRPTPASSMNSRPYDHADKVILFDNSVLKIQKLTARTFNGNRITDTRLILLAGSALCGAGTVWPNGDEFSTAASQGPRLESIKPRPDASYYAIGNSNIGVHAEHAVFYFSTSGITRVVQGAVAVKFPNSETTQDIFSGQQYDADRDLIIPIIDEVDRRLHPYPYWNWLRPQVLPLDMRIPQRLF